MRGRRAQLRRLCGIGGSLATARCASVGSAHIRTVRCRASSSGRDVFAVSPSGRLDDERGVRRAARTQAAREERTRRRWPNREQRRGAPARTRAMHAVRGSLARLAVGVGFRKGRRSDWRHGQCDGGAVTVAPRRSRPSAGPRARRRADPVVDGEVVVGARSTHRRRHLHRKQFIAVAAGTAATWRIARDVPEAFGIRHARPPDGPAPSPVPAGSEARAIHHADVALRRARRARLGRRPRDARARMGTSVVGGWAGTEPGGLAASLRPLVAPRSSRGRPGTPHRRPAPWRPGRGRWAAIGRSRLVSRGRPNACVGQNARPCAATPAHDQLLDEARERFEAAEDFTVAVEEEFALLDPDTLDLVNRFEDVQAAARARALEPNLVGELIASEVEVKTGEAGVVRRRPGGDRRAPRGARGARRAARARARRDRHAPVGELAGPADHRHAALPPQRRDPPVRRLEEQHVRHPRARRDPWRRPRHRGRQPALRNWLPELLALSASSPFAEGVDTGLHSARTQIFTRFFPRCGVPDAFDSWDELRGVRPLPLRDGLDRRAHAALVERAAASRVPDGRDPHLRRAARPRRGAVARRADGRRSRRAARAPRRGRADARRSRTG